MTRIPLSYQVPDISVLARKIETALKADPGLGHLELLNILAKGAGFRNFQHFRASALAGAKVVEPGPMADQTRVAQALRFFDDQGRMKSWPSKTNLQHLCLWGIWSRLPKGQVMSEREFNAALAPLHLFGDPPIIRRTLWELKLIHRSADGRDYQRVEQAPPPDALALIRGMAQG